MKELTKENLYKDEDDTGGKSTICSSFRTLQGWLALSNNKSGEGTLSITQFEIIDGLYNA